MFTDTYLTPQQRPHLRATPLKFTQCNALQSQRPENLFALCMSCYGTCTVQTKKKQTAVKNTYFLRTVPKFTDVGHPCYRPIYDEF